ncbi:MAG: D-tyrosyl-tRNA(Tyr) deacylase [Candidatus Atribacteria bacterium]|nr:MAG: D-tyrosyl-tRNA(Tyr) deacylase [Candidatus Atribacteria bacterium]
MRIVLQRVSRASVDVAGERIAAIGTGLLLLVGISPGDSEIDLSKIAKKIADLRIFENELHKMNASLRDIGGDVLAVSQFTLLADASKGRRPSFTNAAAPEQASCVFDAFVEALRREEVNVQTGRFGAKMAVALENDGPVTLVLEVAA